MRREANLGSPLFVFSYSIADRQLNLLAMLQRQDLPKESLKTFLFRFGMNMYPMYYGTGGRVTYLAGDWTRNYVGTIFGGSMFAVGTSKLNLSTQTTRYH